MKRISRYSFLIIILVGFTPFLWFHGDLLINGTDIDFPIYSYERLLHRLQVWDFHFLGGTDRSNNIASLPYVLVSTLFELIGFNNQYVEKLSFSAWMICVGLSMKFFLGQVLEDHKTLEGNIAIIAGSVIYMVGFYNVFLWVRLQLSISTLIMVPLVLGILTAAYKKQEIYKYIPLLGAVIFMCGPTGLQPPILSIIIPIVIVHFLYFNVINKNKNIDLRVTLRRYLLVTVVSILASIYWILPLGNFIIASNYIDSSVGKEVFSVKNLMGWSSSVTSFVNTFRFYGDVPWFDSWGGERYLEYFKNYQENLSLIILSLFMPLIGLLSPIYSRGLRKKQVIFYLYVFLICLYLGKGLHRPFGELFEWLIDNVPLFWIHRAPWQKFGLFSFFSLCTLFTIGLYYIIKIINNSKNKFKNIIIILIIVGLPIYIVYYNYLFISGKHFNIKNNGNGYHEKFQLGFHNDYPEYIFQSRDYINSQTEDFKIFLLPDLRTNVYDWGYAGSSDISVLLFNKGLIFRQYGEGMVPPNSADFLQNYIANKIYNSPNIHVTKALGLMNVKYIMQRNDFRYYFFNGIDSPEFIKNQLTKIPGISIEKIINKWDFYRLDDKYISGQLYIPKKLVNYGSSDVEVEKMLEVYEKETAFINNNKKYVIPQEKYNYKFNKISTTSYTLEIENARGIMPIVLNESFHNDWNVSLLPSNINDAKDTNNLNDGLYKQYKNWLNYYILRKLSTNISNFVEHNKANFFSNIWIIDVDKICNIADCKKNNDGSHYIKLNIYFEPQDIVFIGFTISIFTLIFISLICYVKIKRK